MLLWQGYPNIGVDERNQFDMLESLPGGIAGLKQLVQDFHDHGVKVLLPYLPWDQGTRNKFSERGVQVLKLKFTTHKVL